jgi:hypothetical protein
MVRRHAVSVLATVAMGGETFSQTITVKL